MSGYLTMWDAIDVTQIPADAQYVAGYVGGKWPTAQALRQRFPRARLLTIAISADEDADCLDIERGDATPGQAAGWYARQRARGVAKPCLYASVSTMQAYIVPAIQALTFPRSQVRLWSAHYGAGSHVCAPTTCSQVAITMDATQFTDQALGGRDLDQSLLLADFFNGKPAPGWTEALMSELPVLREGANGEGVRTVQGLLCARGHTVKIDGSFGPVTLSALVAAQRAAGVAQDGIVGPVTYGVLLGV